MYLRSIECDCGKVAKIGFTGKTYRVINHGFALAEKKDMIILKCATCGKPKYLKADKDTYRLKRAKVVWI